MYYISRDICTRQCYCTIFYHFSLSLSCSYIFMPCILSIQTGKYSMNCCSSLGKITSCNCFIQKINQQLLKFDVSNQQLLEGIIMSELFVELASLCAFQNHRLHPCDLKATLPHCIENSAHVSQCIRLYYPKCPVQNNCQHQM